MNHLGDSPRPGFGTCPDPRRERPDPWFVGNGRGLMIAVLTLIALLVVARVATALWLAEAIWSRWSASSDAADDLAEDVAIAKQQASPIPPTDPSRAGATLHGNPASAFGADMYPVVSMRAGEQGRAVARLLVGANGAVMRCSVTTSSGFARLDRRTCIIALRRIRFDPARDDKGRPISSLYTLPVRWVLPDG